MKMSENPTSLEAIQPLIKQVELSHDDQMARFETMRRQLTEINENLTKIIQQKEDLIRLVADLRRENDHLKAALNSATRHLN